ncbi:hypothetical protein D9613_005365 [Agrocybe pediades]|uniref:DUF952 domain protein n=1 Tax=Agrocybe pediades TaxID=84607 RepID=A0A8H4R093_9AGAR|nr:hypothetical protein D9613_005365 [Agrocybe pediades]
MSTPTYIYKIVPCTNHMPATLPEALPVSDLDNSSGFIHMSTTHQVPGTLKRFFKDHERVYILRVKYADVEHLVKWENSHGTAPGGVGEPDMFPHIYNDLRLGSGEIESWVEWESKGDWDEAINDAVAKKWFVY